MLLHIVYCIYSAYNMYSLYFMAVLEDLVNFGIFIVYNLVYIM